MVVALHFLPLLAMLGGGRARMDGDDGGGPRQLQQATCAAENFAANAEVVMVMCCASAGDAGSAAASPSGHRRLQDCALPEQCPSPACGAAFTSFFESCRPTLTSYCPGPPGAFKRPQRSPS